MPFSLGTSKLDMRKVVKTSLSGVCNYVLFFNKHLSFILFPVLYYIALNLNISFLQVEKSLSAMYKKIQKQITSDELLPSLWEKCKVCNNIGSIHFH